MTQEDIDSMLVNELKLELSKLGAPTSGKKAELVERLKNLRTEPKMISIEADLVEEEESRYANLFNKMKTPVYGPLNLGAIIAIGLSLLMISSVLILKPSWLGFGDDYEYELIDFDISQAKTYAEELVALGHPEWEGRMSGTIEETNTAEIY